VKKEDLRGISKPSQSPKVMQKKAGPTSPALFFDQMQARAPTLFNYTSPLCTFVSFVVNEVKMLEPRRYTKERHKGLG
jgi:hypothetical protein